jgi:signal transduction histidine kinase/ligand-binding sensor domain-containing protein
LPHSRLVQRVPSLSALLALLFCAVPLFSTPAQDASASQYYVVKVWGADEGFTEGSVTDVNQTPEGYLWVGTLFGSVLRFDGARFVSYTSANTPGFVSKWGVPRLMVDAGGALWISMHDGGMTIWNKRGFRPAFSTNEPGPMLWSAPGKVIFAYSDGKLLSGELQKEKWNWETIPLPVTFSQSQHCADANGRVWYLRNDRKIGIFENHATKTLPAGSLVEGHRPKVLMADPKGNIWLGTDKGLFEWQTNHFEEMTPTNGETAINVRRIVASGAGSLWVEANGRMRRCAQRQWLAESEGWNRQMTGVSWRFLHGDAEGGLWSGAGDMGLIHVLEDGTFHRLTTRDGLPSDTVHFAFQDRNGNTWTGYERGGLVQIRRRMFRSIGKEQGLSDSLINTVCEDTNRQLWIGTHSGKINLYQNNICTNLLFPGDTSAQDSCIAADAAGRVWLGGQGIGLSRFEAGHLQQIAAPAQFPKPSDQNFPRLLLPARDGQLWLGTLWTIIRVSGETLKVEYTALTAGEHPTSLAQAADGSIWAGTLAGLLLHWDGKQFVTIEPPDRNSLGRIWALWPAPDGGIWAGTEEGGLLHWKNGAFRRYTAKDGLPSDSIIQILGDRQSNLWLGTRAGIVRISSAALNLYESGNLKGLPVSIYGQPDGLLTIGSAIISQPNCWPARDGALLFAMANSVAAVDPEQVHINPIAPTLTLEELRANEKTIWPTSPGAILTAPPLANTSEPQAAPFKINVAPGRGDLEFQYAGPDLDSPVRVRFKYKLEGLENSWNDGGGDRKAIYRHLPPGDYVFHVMACNSDSVWSVDSALVAVTLAPFFYETLWFRAGIGLLAVVSLSLALVFAYRRRVRLRLDQLERQHDLERERSRIAQDLHDDLGAGLTEIGLLGGLLQKPSTSPARDRQGLDRIVQRCRDLVTALDEIVWAVNPRNDSMNSLGGYLARYAQEFFEPTSIRCRLEIQEMDSQQSFNSEQRHNLFLAFKEALTNVVRHSGATEVRIRIFLENKTLLVVCIEDNGHGLPAVVRDSADGLINLRQRLSRVGGDCEITSTPNDGVIVRMSLPVVSPGKIK